MIPGDYYVVQLIIQKGLHTENDACMLYTTNLMDKLERFKERNPTIDAVHDDTAAQAYCLAFALEIFGRADEALRERKATMFVPQRAWSRANVTAAPRKRSTRPGP